MMVNGGLRSSVQQVGLDQSPAMRSVVSSQVAYRWVLHAARRGTMRRALPDAYPVVPREGNKVVDDSGSRS